MQKLVHISQINYERELAGEKQISFPLNRLFLGNPGTGKTSTALLYGRILKGLGILSDGSVCEFRSTSSHYSSREVLCSHVILPNCLDFLLGL